MAATRCYLPPFFDLPYVMERAWIFEVGLSLNFSLCHLLAVWLLKRNSFEPYFFQPMD